MDPLQLWSESSQRWHVFDIPHSHAKHIHKLQGTAGTLSMVCQNHGLQNLATHEDHEDTGEAVRQRVTDVNILCIVVTMYSTVSEGMFGEMVFSEFLLFVASSGVAGLWVPGQ
jgi:hypothetical protein